MKRKTSPDAKQSPADSAPAPDIPLFALTRRSALKGAAAALAAGPLAPPASCGQSEPTLARRAGGLLASPEQALWLETRVNGQAVSLPIDPRTSLLDLLRERLGLTGAKKGCDHGQCGACTVHLDGMRIASCLMLAAKVAQREVTTIEGLSDGDALHPMQQAFIDHDALQCGYCTPGQIMAAVACVREGNATSAERIREFMSGNLCRCGAYVGIVAAIQAALPKLAEGPAHTGASDERRA